MAVNFPSASVGYIAGDNGTLMKTINGGSTWTQVNLPVYLYNSQIRNVNFVDEETGFIALAKKVYKTVDGGQSWSASPQLNTGTLQGTFFLDHNKGFAFGSNESLAKTTDGGNSWIVLSYSPLTELHYSYLGFADQNNGYVIAQDWYYEEAVVRKTTDGGFSWTNLALPSEIEYVSGLEVLGTGNLWIGAGNAFWSPQTGYIARAYHSTDGGLTWSMHILGQTNSNAGGVLDIKFFNQNEGRIVNLNHIYTTHDGGNTWIDHAVGSNVCISCFSPAAWTDQNTGFIAGYSPALIYTTDNGETYEDLISGGTPLFATTYFKDTLHGFVGGSYNENAMIRYTNDGGITWQDAGLALLADEEVSDIIFSDNVTGWAFYEDGALKSTNGGITWAIHPAAAFSLAGKKASVQSSSTYYVAGSNSGYGGIIYKTADQGNTWNKVFDGIFNYDKVSGFQFTDQMTGYMALKPMTAGASGKLLKTVNGGTSWTDLSFGEQSEILGLSFADNLNGMITLSSKKVMYTHNGGATWTSAAMQFPAAVTYVRLFDQHNGVAAVKGQFLYLTSDGGENFETVYQGTTIWPYASSNAFFLDQEHGWASGYQGMIMRYSATWTNTNSPDLTQDELLQPFFNPNPTRGSIYVTAESGGVICIYSLNGTRIITTEINGNTEVSISHLPAGIYMVMLSTAEGVRVQKLVKL
ncbi:MAG TPA: YCF48-related protein [Lentimicrobium sp.]|nr:YCF48-related protein [Lentimicrobium sp.]